MRICCISQNVEKMKMDYVDLFVFYNLNDYIYINLLIFFEFKFWVFILKNNEVSSFNVFEDEFKLNQIICILQILVEAKPVNLYTKHIFQICCSGSQET